MPHPEQEHSLRIQLATALRERDEWHHAAEEAIASHGKLVEKYTRLVADDNATLEALAAARRECDRYRTALMEAVDAAHKTSVILVDALNSGPLAAARREVERLDLRNQRNQRSRFEKCAQLFAEIRGDWTDPRDACREGRKLCMEALADIDAALAAPGAGEEDAGAAGDDAVAEGFCRDRGDVE